METGSIGTRLRSGREKLGLTVLQAAEKMHVDARILESLEEEDFEALGAPVYARGHLRHYAELVGESTTQLDEIYSSSTQTGQPDLTRIAKATDENGNNRLVVPAVLVLGIFATVGGGIWLSSLSAKKNGAADVNIVEPVGTSSEGESRGAQSPESTSTPVTGGKRTVAPSSVATSHPETAAGPATVVPTSPTDQVSGNGAKAAAASAAGAAGSDAAGRSKHDSQITLRFSADSWAEVYDASGNRLFYDVGAANTVKTVSGTLPLRVVLGNAAGVNVDINGHNTPIDKLAQPDGSAQFSINRSGRATRTRLAANGG